MIVKVLPDDGSTKTSINGDVAGELELGHSSCVK